MENQKATFDHVLKGPLAVKGFLGEVAGKKVAILVYKEGKDAGKVATAIVPSPTRNMCDCRELASQESASENGAILPSRDCNLVRFRAADGVWLG